MSSYCRMLSAGAIVAASSVVALGCHHAAPATVAPATRLATTDNSASSRARADSLARTAARSDSLARAARRDSIDRANAMSRAAQSARDALVSPVHFDLDHAEIRADERPLLDKKASLLAANPRLHLRVDGNADDRGSDEYNLALGMRRAAEVRRYFMQHGIDSTRVAIDSYGEERPTCQQEDETCWSRNRRDDFAIVSGGNDIVSVP